LLDYVPGGVVEVHFNGHTFVSVLGQVDADDSSFVDSSHTHFGAWVETGRIRESRLYAIGSVEPRTLSADQEHSPAENQKCYDDEQAEPKLFGHSLLLKLVSSSCLAQETGDKLILTLLQVLKSSLDQDISAAKYHNVVRK